MTATAEGIQEIKSLSSSDLGSNAADETIPDCARTTLIMSMRHGTGNWGSDAHEALALGKVFGNRRSRPAVVGTESLTGHALGAAGVLEAIAAVQPIVHNVIPPALGAAPIDQELDIDVVVGTPRETEVRAALSNSFAFGGHNAVLAFTQPGYAA